MSSGIENERRYLAKLLDAPLGEVSDGNASRLALYFVTSEHELPITYFITVGFGDVWKFELGLLVGGHRLSATELQSIGRALLTTAGHLAANQTSVLPEHCVATPALEPIFRGRSASYLTDWETDAPTYLPLGGADRARLILLQPIFEEERRWIGTMSQQQVLRAFLDADVAVENADRDPLLLTVGPKILPGQMSKTESQDFKKLFDSLMAWGAEHNARVGELEAPANASAIEKLEAAIGRKIPDDLRAALEVSDGGPCLGNFDLNGATRIAKRCEQQAQFIDEPSDSESESCKRVKWSKGWIPFAEDGGQNFRCIDLDPGPKGVSGQVIWYDSELEKAGATKFDSFGSWLQAAVTDCTSGKAMVDSGGMVDLSEDMR